MGWLGWLIFALSCCLALWLLFGLVRALIHGTITVNHKTCRWRHEPGMFLIGVVGHVVLLGIIVRGVWSLIHWEMR